MHIQHAITNKADGSVKIVHVPNFDAIANQYLAMGANTSGVSIVVRLTWTDNQSVVSQDFTYLDTIVETWVDSYNPTNNKYGKALNATFTQVWLDEGDNIKVSVVIVSDRGVEISSESKSLG